MGGTGLCLPGHRPKETFLLPVLRFCPWRSVLQYPCQSFYTFTTRLGIDMQGPKIGKAKTSAKVEVDFGGFSASTTMLRIRQAYVALDWERTRLLIGQTWHPLFGSVVPDVLNLSTGAPFQPFNREPQIAFTWRHCLRSVAASIHVFRTGRGKRELPEKQLCAGTLPRG